MADAWYNASWSNRRKITFDNSAQAANLTDFPVLVKLNSSRIDYAKTQNSGQDIRITDSDGTTLLSYEIETWNESGDSFVWVKVPQINASSSTDYIYVYYGNAGASDAQAATSVWRSEYKGVWHLKETGAGTASEYKDSTSNANHGRGGGGTAGQIPTTTTGQIGTAQTFDGSNDYIQVPNAASLYAAGAFTVGAWVRRTGTPASQWGGYIYSDYNSEGGATSVSLVIEQSNKASLFIWENKATSTDVLPLNTWTWVVGVYEGSGTNYKRVYINGSANGTNNTSDPARSDVGGNTAFGRPGDYPDLYAPAGIDQVWFYGGALSAAWIAAQYKSETDAFCTYGSEETSGGSSDDVTPALLRTRRLFVIDTWR